MANSREGRNCFQNAVRIARNFLVSFRQTPCPSAGNASGDSSIAGGTATNISYVSWRLGLVPEFPGTCSTNLPSRNSEIGLPCKFLSVLRRTKQPFLEPPCQFIILRECFFRGRGTRSAPQNL